MVTICENDRRAAMTHVGAVPAEAETSSTDGNLYMSEKQVISDAFLQITEFSWLEDAFRHARKAKRYRNDFLAFSNDLDTNLLTIQEQLRADTFIFGPYRRHWVFVPKKRLVMALSCPSRIVQWAIYLLLNPSCIR